MQPDIITGRQTGSRYLKILNHRDEWDIPLLFFYDVLNGRYLRRGDNVMCHIAPCMLKYNYEHFGNEAYEDLFRGNDVILLSVWLTRCNKPEMHLIVWDPTDVECRRITRGQLPFLNRRYSDPAVEFDWDKAKE
jgi:hypothetical protein